MSQGFHNQVPLKRGGERKKGREGKSSDHISRCGVEAADPHWRAIFWFLSFPPCWKGREKREREPQRAGRGQFREKHTPSGTRQQNRSLCADLACLFPLSNRLGSVFGTEGGTGPLPAHNAHTHTHRRGLVFPQWGLLIEDYHAEILRVLCRCNVYIYILGETAHNEAQQ